MSDSVFGMHPSLRHWALRAALLATIMLALFALPNIARADWHPITPILPDHTNLQTYKISPDSTTVAFVADIDVDNVADLYTVPISETQSVKISPSFVEGGSIANNRFDFAPDSQSILYLADQEVDNRVELYSVPVGGGTPLKLNGPLVAGGNVQQFLIDDDSDRVLYFADGETNEVFELFSVPLAGGAAVKLNQAMVTGGNVSQFKVDTIGNRVVFTADAETDGKYELYSVPIAGGTVVKLNPPIVLHGGGDSGIFDFEVNPGLPVVTFTAREAGEPGGNIYTAPSGGGDLLGPLNFNLLAEQRILFFRVSPLGDRVVYNVGTRVGSTNAFKGVLHSALIGGGGAGQVSDSADPLFGSGDFRFLPDGSRVVYNFQEDASATVHLMSAEIFGTPVDLYAPAIDDDPLVNFRFSDNSDWVIYFTATGGGSVRILTVPPTGGGSTNLGVGFIEPILPDSSRVLFQRDLGGSNADDLISAQIFGGGVRNLSGLPAPGFANRAVPSPDSEWVVFTANTLEGSQLRVSDGEEAQPLITGLTASNNGPKAVDTPVSFTTVITGGESISFTWEFGDGETGAGAAPTHAYDAGGTYTATVTAVSSANTVTATTVVYIGDAVVEVTNNEYTPADVIIPHGGTVVWVLKEGNHSVTANDGSFEQPAGTDWGQFVHTFDHALAARGTEDEVIPYHCSVHGLSMSGTVTLQGEIVEPGDLKVMLPLIGGE